MEIKFTTRNKAEIVEIIGNLDGATAEAARDEILPHIVPECVVVFDMRGCRYISSAGLRVLLMCAKQIAKQGGRGAMSGLSEEIKDVMEMTGFGSIFNCYDSVSEAIAELSRGASS